MDIEWADPPPSALRPGQKGHYAEFAATLRSHPEKWAILPDGSEPRTEKGAKGTEANIRNGRMTDFKPKGAFETALDGVKIYVRYAGVPPEGDETPDDDRHEWKQHRNETAKPPEDMTGVTEDMRVAPSKIRAWAREKGMEVSTRGALSEEVIRAYYRQATRPKHVQALP